jgi:diguanylate cyclase (GGDEF)-like protein
MSAHGLGSAVVLPLLVDGEVAGTLTLVAPETGFFDDEEMKLLQELAGDIAFALDHIGKSEKIEYLAYYDPLTGLANRTLFQERLNQFISTSARDEGTLAVLLFDIERFRAINETLGRTASDELLKQIAARTGGVVSNPSELARLGADHFACVVPGITGTEDVVRRVEDGYKKVFGEPFQLGDTELRVSARSGIALYPDDGADADTLLRNAEAALKKAKSGGDKILFYARQMTERGAENLTLENKLQQALEKDEFVLHYQPKVDVETRRIVGVEALIRWQSAELGLVSPGKFIPLLEETGLILRVGTWALRRAALEHRRWVELGLDAPRVAVNVSMVQLRQRGFVTAVEQAISEGVMPSGIDLEITESLVMQDIEANIQKLKDVRGLGLAIAIDDFGTGYSSLGYLAKLPVQTLKIDRSFITSMVHDADTLSLVRMIISLAHSLRLTVVAEGVETEEQVKMLRLLGCDAMQGYLFGKPVPFEAMTALLQTAQEPYLAAA